MYSSFSFGEHSTAEFHMRIEKYPHMAIPARKKLTFSVAGRNGDLHALEDAWENYPQRYAVYFHGDASAPQLAHKIKAWLASAKGYQRLQDTYDPDYYRMAIFKGPMDIENILNAYGRCTIEFDCAPQSFLISGDTPVIFSAPGVLMNGTSFEAKPIITIRGNAAGSVTVGSRTVEVKGISDPIVLDCELMQAYCQLADGTPVYQNGSIHAPTFPSLVPGENIVSFSGGISSVEIIPRWWTL